MSFNKNSLNGIKTIYSKEILVFNNVKEAGIVCIAVELVFLTIHGIGKGVFIISFNFYVVSVLFALIEGIVYVKSILFELIKNKTGSGIHYCLITVCQVERGKVVGTTPGKVNYESKCAYEQKQRNDSDNNCFCVTTHFLLPSLIRM